MLTKQTKQTAEKMAQELAPLFANIRKLGETLQKAANETRKAHQVAIAWQYPNSKAYAEDAGENWEEINRIKEANCHEWSETLHAKYKALNEKETAEKVARLNYRNYCAFICDTFAHLLHTGDNWEQFHEKKGIESLSDLINSKLKEATSGKIGIYISRDGGSWDPFSSIKYYCYLKITLWGVCCVKASNWGTYSKTTQTEGREWKEPQAPKLYTLAQYVRLIKELKELENKAKATAREHHEKARASGLIYYIGGLQDPSLKVWGQND